MYNLTDEQKQILKLEDKRIDFYFKVENEVIDNTEIFSNIYESHLFIVLSRYCNNNNVAFPSYNTLAKLCYCSRSTIIRAMKSLESKGLINKVIRIRNDENTYESNLYTINNLKKYIGIEKEPSASATLGVVSEKYYPSVSDTLYKEQIINKNIIKNNTTTEFKELKKLKEKKDSSRYEFLNLPKYNLLNIPTKINIEKNINNLSEMEFSKIYNLARTYIENGKGQNFNAILYKGLKNEWNFNLENGKEETIVELDNSKKKWLNYFSGIICDKDLKKEVEKIIFNISLKELDKNKSKLSKMNPYEFKQYLYYLKKISS